MIKIFINDKPFILSDKPINEYDRLNCEYIVMHKEHHIMDFVRKAEEMHSKCMIIESPNAGSLFLELLSNFKSIEAGGGVVLNEKDEVLFIFRAGKWDLPKGKVDSGELVDEAAIREVQEECGLKELQMVQKLPTTYHSYKIQGHRFMKVSHWYEMRASSTEKLVPQQEESITEVAWKKWSDLDIHQLNTYSSIAELLLTLKNKEWGEFPKNPVHIKK